MKARLLIQGSNAFDPEALKILGQVFDDAWSEIAASDAVSPEAIEDARLRLAHIVLDSASGREIEPDQLKREVVRAYRFPRPSLA